MRRSTFNKHIDQLGEDELREELGVLYSKFEAVRTYYSMELGSEKDRQKRYESAKKEIRAKYATKSYRKPRRPRIQKINKILSELKKMSVFGFEMIDIYLFNVEEGLKFMKEYNFYSSPLFNILNNTFEKALILIKDSRMEDQYAPKVEKILKDSRIDFELHLIFQKKAIRLYDQ